MARSHPPTLLKIAERTLSEECGLEAGQRIVLGVSGGVDSIALLHVLSRLRSRFGYELFAHGVDHGLRAAAASELEVARASAQKLEVPFTVTRVEVAPGGNLQARARAARYRALEAAAEVEGGALLATAHHADDRAETVLIRLLRGAGIVGLGVLPPRAGRLLRPLVRATRADILRHAERHGLAYIEDPSNADARFLRVRVRREVLPLLSELSPNVVLHLNRLADEALGRRTPTLTDEGGIPILLGRAQREQMQRARRFRQVNARIPIGSGLEVGFDAKTGGFSVVRTRGDAKS